ncbi:MAG: hypothetical protein GY756_07470 [bacterium]|nr:hypothetical protein [bacterium]
MNYVSSLNKGTKYLRFSASFLFQSKEQLAVLGYNTGNSVSPTIDSFETYGETGIAPIIFILLGVLQVSYLMKYIKILYKKLY